MIKTKAHSNIALIKYWGKKDEALKIPYNSSISVTLEGMTTYTTIEKSHQDQFYLNGIQHSFDLIAGFVELFRQNQGQPILVKSYNSFPTAAGLASSASGYAALGVGLNEFFGLQLTTQQLSILVRQGSGSACRSLWPNLAVWKTGNHSDDSYSYPLESSLVFDAFVVLAETDQKKISSRDMMKEVVEHSPLYPTWLKQSEIDFNQMLSAIERQDIKQIGEIAQRNALLMHETIHVLDSSFSYFNESTKRIIDCVMKLQQNTRCFFTIDAGPNVVVFTDPQDREMVKEELLKLGLDMIEGHSGEGAKCV